MRVRLDEESLKKIANITHGEYFYAGTATDLKKIYENLNSRLFFEQKETEITALFAAAAAVLALLSATPVAALVQPDSLTSAMRRRRAGDGRSARRGGAWPVNAALTAAFHCCGSIAVVAMRHRATTRAGREADRHRSHARASSGRRGRPRSPPAWSPGLEVFCALIADAGHRTIRARERRRRYAH